MMTKLTRWLQRPPALTRKFGINLRVQSLEDISDIKVIQDVMMMVKIEWCRPKRIFANPFRGSQTSAWTSRKGVEQGSTIYWQEEFKHLCVFTDVDNHTSFSPLHVDFTIYQVAAKASPIELGAASMNLAELAGSQTVEKEQMRRLDVSSLVGQPKHVGILVVYVSFYEDSPVETPRSDCSWVSTLSCLSNAFLSNHQANQICQQQHTHMQKEVPLSEKAESGELHNLMYSCNVSRAKDMTARFEEDTSDKESVAGSEEIKGTDAENQLLHSYSPLSGMNQVMTEGMLSTFTDVKRNLPLTSSMTSSSNYDDKVSNIVPDQGAHMRRLLSWRRRRKYRVVQECREPLLRKAQNGTGGDDIDRDRNLSFMYPLSQGSNHALFSSEDISEFLSDGDVQFSIGYWERKELVNRIGHTKLLTEVFFASIDQRSERAGGESACTALVVVIADWLHRNPDRMPIRAEFDTLIRQGSAEWRKLCDNEFHRKEFPDYHFDLETVLQAKIRPLGIVKGGTYVGFFKPEMENHMFDVLQGAALFDDVWEASIVEGSALLKTLETVEPAIYIVSWNDHFFVLKVDRESYSIIDTLGERLYEGCKQAYMLRFNKETVLTHQIDSDKQFDGKKDNQCSLLPLYSSPKCCFSSHISNTSSTQEPQKTPDSSHSHPHLQDERVQVDGSPIQDADNFEISYSGRDACKEFIKSFYAAIALKQLYKDIQNRRLGTNPVHRRLQIEFHHTCRLSNLESEQEISSIVQNT